MEDFSKKITLLYIPFLLTSIGLCLGYTFLNWLIIINLELISIKDVIIDFGLPLILPAIPVLFYLRPKLKLLNLSAKKGGSWIDFYTFILWVAISVPILIAQNYIETATGELTPLKNISQLDSLPKTKYYSVEGVYIEKNNIGTNSVFEVSGKHNENFDMYIYVTVPMYRSATDTTEVISWLGLNYSKSIKNNLEDNEKEEAYTAFANQTQLDFDQIDLTQFGYLMRVPNSDKGDGLRDAVKKSTKYTVANSTQLFWSVNEPFEDRNGNTLAWTGIVFAIGSLIWLIMIIIPAFDPAVLQAHESGAIDSNEEVKEFVDYLKPKEGFFITPILVYANVGIFLLMFFMGFGFMSFNSKDLIIWGANYGPLTMQGEWWRLATNTFLHGGFMHLAANMYGLLFVGIFLEPLLGRMKYVGIYLLTGIIASAASLWWNDTVVSMGASGAIFGLYGAFIALILTRVFPKEMGAGFLVSMFIFVGFNLVMGLIGNGIDNAAHIGGLVSGFLIGLALYPSLKGTFKMDGVNEKEESVDEDE
ncbi:rhomboid family intramembrane serine protease [uncultured Cytophaga sp.]|uniref:rhomboid family intramembrane serine protease n=1 Tax=uncultured Cytophaga sp. TaxID=160238 RepID=UPI002615ED68|nr:rhomboid family intramembrane serine protease [uncultured Cytophaga sp.]